MPKIIKPAKGSFTAASVTIDSSGRVVAASSGSAGVAGTLVMTDFRSGSGNVDTVSGATNMVGYLTGGGGGAGNDGNSAQGGFGGRAVFEVPVSHPQSIAFATGSAGVAAGNQNGNDGNDSTFGDPALVTCEGGEKGFVSGIAGTNNPGSVSFANSGITEFARGDGAPGSPGQGASEGNIGFGSTGLMGGSPGQGKTSGPGSPGKPGFQVVFQNIGS